MQIHAIQNQHIFDEALWENVQDKTALFQRSLRLKKMIKINQIIIFD